MILHRDQISGNKKAVDASGPPIAASWLFAGRSLGICLESWRNHDMIQRGGGSKPITCRDDGMKGPHDKEIENSSNLNAGAALAITT